MKSTKSITGFLKPPTEERRRSSVGSIRDGVFDDLRPRSLTLDQTAAQSTSQCQKQISVECRPQPLDLRQMYRLRASWKVVQRNLENVSSNLFVTFFRKHPEAIEHYRLWRVICEAASSSLNLPSDKKFDVLKFDDDFRSQSAKFLRCFDDIIQRLDDPEALNNALRSLACYHRKLCQAPVEMVLKLRQPFLESMKVALEDRFNKEVEEIYEIFLEYVLGEVLLKLRTPSSRSPSIDAGKLLDSSPSRLIRDRRGSVTPNLKRLPKIDD